MKKYKKTADATQGGLFVGKSHDEGGIPAIIVDSGQLIEVEGGEAIINKEATKKYWKELSKINQSAGNGVPIPPPMAFSGDVEKYKHGGKVTLSAIRQGTEIEMEHAETIEKLKNSSVSTRKFAEQVAKDHLKENPNYYKILSKLKLAKGGEVVCRYCGNNWTNLLQDNKHNLFECNNCNKDNSKFYKTGGTTKNFNEKENIYNEWKSLVNMSKNELQEFYNTQEGQKAGLSIKESRELGIDNGRTSARWIMKMKDLSFTNWSPTMWKWAKKQISFIKRMRGNKGSLYDEKGNKTRKHTSLLIWGHNPEKFNLGGNTNIWEKNDFKEYPKTTPNEWILVEWSLNGHSPIFKGKLYFQSGTGFMFIEKENGEIYQPKPSNKLFWRHISENDVHKKIEEKNNFERGGTIYQFEYNCVYPNCSDELETILENMKSISADEFLKNVSLEELNNSLMYGIKYESKSRLKSDWSVSFYKIKKKNIDAYVFVNSGIEYVFKKLIFNYGGQTLSQTPAPKKEQIFGSKTNDPNTSESIKSAEQIILSDKTIESIKTILDKHNSVSNKKVDINTAKAVVRRGMGAYSTSHRPTISDGKPNNRVAWGLARLKAFLFKIKMGKSKSGKYSQDNDLINELSYYHQKFENGSIIPFEKKKDFLAPNGKPSNLTPEQYLLVRSSQFKAWFGDWEKLALTKIYDSGIDEISLKRLEDGVSKVVDENGEPMVVYHGTDADFNVFDISVPIKHGRGEGEGFYFTREKNISKVYGKKIKPFFLNAKKSWRGFDSLNSEEKKIYLSTKNDKDAYEKLKIDFIFISENHLIVFRPNQIKLADGSNTTFDNINSDIRFEQGGKIKELISKGIVQLNFYETTPEHAKEYGLEAKKPLYVQNLFICENERLKGVGKTVLNYLENFARKNGNDVIFGHVRDKALFTKDSRKSFLSDVEMIKYWLHNNKYSINQDNNDFHKFLKFSDKINTNFAKGGLVDDIFTLNRYNVLISEDGSYSHEEYSGTDYDEALSIYNGIVPNDYVRPNSNFNYKNLINYSTKYKFVGELEEGYEVSDFVDFLDDEDYWEIIDTDTEDLFSDKVEAINHNTDKIIAEIRDLINTKYVNDRFSSKYMDISVYADDDDENYLDHITVRITDHSQNPLNKKGRYNLSFVIADLNDTKNRWRSNDEFYFDSSDDLEIIFNEVKNIIDDKIQEVKDDSNFAKGGLLKKGDCYVVAGTIAINKKLPLSKVKNKIVNFVGTPYVVHAQVMGQGEIENLKYGHAWVEDDIFVYDFSNGRELILPKELYYTLGNIVKEKPKYFKYTFNEAVNKMLETGHYGSWELKTESGL